MECRVVGGRVAPCGFGEHRYRQVRRAEWEDARDALSVGGLVGIAFLCLVLRVSFPAALSRVDESLDALQDRLM